jgi:hypothetical protein
MNDELNVKDLDFILESLNYTRLKFEEYEKFPNQDYKKSRIEEVNTIIQKVNKLKQTFKEF